MRKAMLLFIVLLAVGIGGTCCANAALTAAQDDVSFTEVAAYGDVSSADGLTVSTRAQLAHHLLWDTAHTFGQVPQTHTDAQFSAQNLYFNEEESRPDALNLYMLLGFSASSSSNLLGDQAFPVISEMLRDVASRTPNGVYHSENIHLRDYYDYYPISAELYIDGYYFVGSGDNGSSIDQSGNNEEVREAFSRYFQLTVPKTETITVEIQKNSTGAVVGINTELENPVGLSSVSVATENGIYFALNANSIADFSNTPGGFGIYLLPASTMLDDDGGTIQTLEYQNLQTVYPLNVSASVLTLQLSEDGRCLNLITKEDGGLFLTVIEIATMTETQKLPILADMEDAGVQMLNFDDGILFVLLDNDRFMLAEQQEDNTYQPMLSDVRVDALEIGTYISRNTPEIAWDGTRLAFVSARQRYIPRDDSYYLGDYWDSCGFVLEVYDKSGLTYQGEYESSLDVLTSNRCRLTDTEGLSAHW
ncbi:MAG: hypothetical protein LUG13_09085 [Oscillospiraceae bacterium]|nr:hypothetical protein [Oscillospiraceae bacterium]